MQSRRFSRPEVALVVALVLGVIAGAALPVIPQSQSYHQFADQRSLPWLPNVADVLSNLPFALVGVFGLWQLRPRTPWNRPLQFSLLLLFTGLSLTAFGSAYYHWSPSDRTLVMDRLPMTVVFAGVLGGVVAERIGERSAWPTLLVLALLGPASVLYWQSSGNLAPYIVVQAGGVLVAVSILLLTPRPSAGLPWMALLAWYIVAKLAESGDTLIWRATGGWFAGHALKHVAAALGGWSVARAIRA
jgi:hypothetical protein